MVLISPGPWRTLCTGSTSPWWRTSSLCPRRCSTCSWLRLWWWEWPTPSWDISSRIWPSTSQVGPHQILTTGFTFNILYYVLECQHEMHFIFIYYYDPLFYLRLEYAVWIIVITYSSFKIRHSTHWLHININNHNIIMNVNGSSDRYSRSFIFPLRCSFFLPINLNLPSFYYLYCICSNNDFTPLLCLLLIFYLKLKNASPPFRGSCGVYIV